MPKRSRNVVHNSGLLKYRVASRALLAWPIYLVPDAVPAVTHDVSLGNETSRVAGMNVDARVDILP